MRLFNVEYNPDEHEGIYALSVVKSPAMQSNWITLSENKSIKLATVDAERRILMGIALIPNKPIYRKDENGEYNIIFSSKTVEQAAHDFVKKGNVNNSTLEHEIDLGSDAVSVVESWIIESEINDKTRKYGFKEPVGSWAVMMKVHDDATWDKAKNGEILGFSIDGLFNLQEITKKVTMNEKKESKSILQKLSEMLVLHSAKDVKLGSVLTADGVEVQYEGETLEAGAAVFIENEGEQVPLPVGDYTLEDGKMLMVVEEGIASEIMDAAEDIPEGEAELSDVEVERFAKLLDKALGLKELRADSKMLKTELASIKAENESMKAQLIKFGAQPATAKVQAKSEGSNYVPKNAKERILFTIQKNRN